MKIANLPNVIHALDGIYARRVYNSISYKGIECIVNHDAFYVTYYKVEDLLLSAMDSIKIEENLGFNFSKEKNKKLEKITIFILL